MFLVIFRFKGERYEMTFLPGERGAAEAIAQRYGTTVMQPGALVSSNSPRTKPVSRRKVA